MSYLHDQPGWQDSVMRLLDVFVDGLRVQKTGNKEPLRAPRLVKAKTARR
jgi:hypothetical protein